MKGESLRTPTYRQDTSWAKLEEKWDVFRSKVGIGWLIIGYLFYAYPQRLESVGAGGETIYFIVFVLTIAFYYLLRQKLLKKIEKIWLRSLICGIIAYASILLIAILLAVGVAPFSTK